MDTFPNVKKPFEQFLLYTIIKMVLRYGMSVSVLGFYQVFWGCFGFQSKIMTLQTNPSFAPLINRSTLNDGRLFSQG